MQHENNKKITISEKSLFISKNSSKLRILFIIFLFHIFLFNFGHLIFVILRRELFYREIKGVINSDNLILTLLTPSLSLIPLYLLYKIFNYYLIKVEIPFYEIKEIIKSSKAIISNKEYSLKSIDCLDVWYDKSYASLRISLNFSDLKLTLFSSSFASEINSLIDLSTKKNSNLKVNFISGKLPDFNWWNFPTLIISSFFTLNFNPNIARSREIEYRIDKSIEISGSVNDSLKKGIFSGYNKEVKELNTLSRLISDEKRNSTLTGGCIVYGPAGTGKTTLCNNFLYECKDSALCFSFSGESLTSSKFSELLANNSTNLKSILLSYFRFANDQFIRENNRRSLKGLKKLNKIIIFIDEIDRTSLLNTPFFKIGQKWEDAFIEIFGNIQYSDLTRNIFMIATTNNFDLIKDNEALLRPEGFSLKIEIGYPNVFDFEKIASVYLDKFLLEQNKVLDSEQKQDILDSIARYIFIVFSNKKDNNFVFNNLFSSFLNQQIQIDQEETTPAYSFQTQESEENSLINSYIAKSNIEEEQIYLPFIKTRPGSVPSMNYVDFMKFVKDFKIKGKGSWNNNIKFTGAKISEIFSQNYSISSILRSNSLSDKKLMENYSEVDIIKIILFESIIKSFS